MQMLDLELNKELFMEEELNSQSNISGKIKLLSLITSSIIGD